MGRFSRLSYLYKEFTKMLKKPSLFLELFHREYWAVLRANFAVGKSWSENAQGQGLQKRNYASYEDYLAHQKVKLDYIHLVKEEREGLADYHVKYCEALRERLEKLPVAWPGKTVLCLAARLGTEVKSFLQLGGFAVGIDLNPGENNSYVLYGDFHDLVFPDHSVDVVFSNSFDHVYDIDKVISEIKRVLKMGGLLLLEVQQGSDQGRKPGLYESFWWSKIDALAALLEERQLKMVGRFPIEYPWEGEFLIFTPSQGDSAD
ncbi:MAG: class I SAM-dependent methyltransferase [Deltaproteobacteria bacterium]|nr:class I SAM-dependent methyltransferase [Deltaproteobacteria bacterium]